jgi:hypothetical protein
MIGRVAGALAGRVASLGMAAGTATLGVVFGMDGTHRTMSIAFFAAAFMFALAAVFGGGSRRLLGIGGIVAMATRLVLLIFAVMFFGIPGAKWLAPVLHGEIATMDRNQLGFGLFFVGMAIAIFVVVGRSLQRGEE